MRRFLSTTAAKAGEAQLEALRKLGLSDAHIGSMGRKWPEALRIEPSQIEAVGEFFSRQLRLKPDRIAIAVRRTPGILAMDVDTELAPVNWFLRDDVGLNAAKLLEACPDLLLLGRAALEERVAK